MSHSLVVDGVQLYAWCAWDTLFLPAVLETEARVRSVDPNDGAPVRLSVTPAGVRSCEPESVVLSFLVPDGPLGEDVVTTFCHYVHFFVSPASADAWTAAHDGTFMLGLDDAFDLGRRWNAARGI
jgi:alkylmercury lyase